MKSEKINTDIQNRKRNQKNVFWFQAPIQILRILYIIK
jgi:hypothetical protein